MQRKRYLYFLFIGILLWSFIFTPFYARGATQQQATCNTSTFTPTQIETLCKQYQAYIDNNDIAGLQNFYKKHNIIFNIEFASGFWIPDPWWAKNKEGDVLFEITTRFRYNAKLPCVSFIPRIKIIPVMWYQEKGKWHYQYLLVKKQIKHHPLNTEIHYPFNTQEELASDLSYVIKNTKLLVSFPYREITGAGGGEITTIFYSPAMWDKIVEFIYRSTPVKFHIGFFYVSEIEKGMLYVSPLYELPLKLPASVLIRPHVQNMLSKIGIVTITASQGGIKLEDTLLINNKAEKTMQAIYASHYIKNKLSKSVNNINTRILFLSESSSNKEYIIIPFLLTPEVYHTVYKQIVSQLPAPYKQIKTHNVATWYGINEQELNKAIKNNKLSHLPPIVMLIFLILSLLLFAEGFIMYKKKWK